MNSKLTHLKMLFFEALFPKICVGCESKNQANTTFEYICNNCYKKIQIRHSLNCPVCKRRIILGKLGGVSGHNYCLVKNPYILGAATHYQDKLVREMIVNYKFKGIKPISLPLAELVSKYIKLLNIPMLSSYKIIPIPLHPKRQKQRGFNQAHEISRIIAKTYSIDLFFNCLVRTKNTKPQSKLLTWEKRKKNIAGSFSIINPKLIIKQNILLIDDVYTSGNTIIEASKTLKQAGAKRVLAIVVAKK